MSERKKLHRRGNPMKTVKRAAVFLTFAAVIAVIVVLLFYHGVLLFNNPSSSKYPVRGVDVSSYQGEIDWTVLCHQGIQFAFIKATEGSSFVDPNFADNYQAAQKTSLRIGAYHFFSFDSPGRTQAENFISVVSKIDDMLPPVVDFEFYGDKEANLPDAEVTRMELDRLLEELEAYYGMQPIIYATEKSYALYLSGHYASYDIWIRNVFTKPKPLNNQTWTFWQYTNREHLAGYTGDEYYIDMNVFNGTLEDFMNYAK